MVLGAPRAEEVDLEKYRDMVFQQSAPTIFAEIPFCEFPVRLRCNHRRLKRQFFVMIPVGSNKQILPKFLKRVVKL
jgi:hypothetical protein